MKYKNSILPFIFMAIISGSFILFWILGTNGVIDVEGTETTFWIIWLIFPLIAFIAILIHIIYRPSIIKFTQERIFLRSIGFFPVALTLPKKSIQKAEIVTLVTNDYYGEGIRIHFNRNDEKIIQIRNSFRSKDFFGFNDNYFDWQVDTPKAVMHEIVKRINNEVKTG